MPSIGYLGPPGTFSEEALQANLADRFSALVPYPTVTQVLLAVQAGEVDSGIVPIENSIEGSVNATIDTLTFETDLLIEAELVHPVSHRLVARPGVRPEQLTAIVSHPQATAQCRRYLNEHFPGVTIIAANSTAEAAQIVSGSDEPEGALATELAAKLYGLDVLERDVEDYEYNMTRFIVAGRTAQPRTGTDKTTLICFIQENRPGSLLEILTELASRSINLTKIESRPTKKVLGEYYFFIDIEGHQDDDDVAAALAALVGILRELKLLGSYPAVEVP